MENLLIESDDKYLYYYFDENNVSKLLEKMSKILFFRGFVEESYGDAVVIREKEFPTGLPTNGINIAIPHTDSIHVKREGILVGVLEHPIDFEVMGTPGEFTPVKLVFMLSIKDPTKQVEMLQKLIMLCQDQESLEMLKNVEDITKIKEILTNLS